MGSILVEVPCALPGTTSCQVLHASATMPRNVVIAVIAHDQPAENARSVMSCCSHVSVRGAHLLNDVGGRSSLTARSLFAGNEADGHSFRIWTDDAADDVRPVLVVLGVIGGVDCRVGVGCRVFECHVALDTARTDTPDTPRCGMPVPRAIRTACGSDVDLIADADDPHRR